jgi:hypothetical protein
MNSDNSFPKRFRKFFPEEEELPCLKCSDENISSCSQREAAGNGCFRFRKYCEGRNWRRKRALSISEEGD